MSLRNHTHLKLIGAAGAAALAIGTVAAPAVAASQDINYTCNTLGPTSIGIDPGAIPAKMVAGQASKRKMKMVVHLSSGQADLARDQDVTGNVVAKGAHNTFPFKVTIPSQTVPPTGAVDIHASGPGTIRPLKAGKWTVKAGNITANLTLSLLGPISDSCSAPKNNTTNYGTIKVSKDKTKTAASASYSAKKNTATGTAKVKSHFGLKPTGKVTFTLMRGTHKVATQKGKLNKKGVAKAAFKHVTKKGDYALVAKYAGNKNLKGSSSGQPFVV